MEKINFLIIKEGFEKLSKGSKAELRRVANLTDIFKQGVSYRLLPKGEKPSRQWERVLFFIPFGSHIIDGKRLGELFALLEIKNDKLQQMLKSTYPSDLLLLRDLLKWIDNKGLLKLNYQYLAEALYFWGAGYKSSIEKDYFYTKRLIEKGDVQPIKDLMATLRDPDKEFDGIDVPKVVTDNLPTYTNESKSVANDLESANLDDKEQPSQKAKPKANNKDKVNIKTKIDDNDNDDNDLLSITSDNNLVAQVDTEVTQLTNIEATQPTKPIDIELKELKQPTEPTKLSESNFVEINISKNSSKSVSKIASKSSSRTKSAKMNQINKENKSNINNNETSTKAKLIKRNKDIKE
ncbi:MAG: hypothetical protein WAQ98_00490 [Blastocatellia bacterium]